MTYLKSFFNKSTYLQSTVFFFSKKALEITRLCYTMWRDLRLSSYDSIRFSLLTLSLTGVRNLKKKRQAITIPKQAWEGSYEIIKRYFICILVQLWAMCTFIVKRTAVLRERMIVMIAIWECGEILSDWSNTD